MPYRRVSWAVGADTVGTVCTVGLDPLYLVGLGLGAVDGIRGMGHVVSPHYSSPRYGRNCVGRLEWEEVTWFDGMGDGFLSRVSLQTL